MERKNGGMEKKTGEQKENKKEKERNGHITKERWTQTEKHIQSERKEYYGTKGRREGNRIER